MAETTHTSEATLELTAERFRAPGDLARLGTLGLVVGLLGLLLSGVGFFLDPEQFYRSYLVAFVFAVAVPLGSLAFLMIGHVSGGGWALVVRRVNEASAATLPFLGLFFLPVALGIRDLYLWTDPEKVHGDHILEQKTWYLDIQGFYIRALVFFVLVSLLAWILWTLSSRQDKNPEKSAALIHRMRQVAAPGILLLAVLLSMASYDWLMSLDPHWYSSMYGVYFMGTVGLGGMSFMILMGRYLVRRAPMSQVILSERFHDWGKLLLAMTMVWAYFSVSQFLIIWSGNLPEEVLWYLHRQEHGWGWWALVLIFGHFVLPFMLLLSRPLKRASGRLVWVAALLLLMQWWDYFWQAGPVFHRHLSLHWLDLTTVLALGGVWLFLFTTLLRRRPLVPINDPYLPESLES